MTFTEEPGPGVYGAKVQSWRHANPRDILKRIIDEHPNEDKAFIFREFKEQIRDDEDVISAIIEYWFSNNYHSLMGDRPERRAQRQEERAERAREREKKTEAMAEIIKERAKKLVILDMVMPNGKLLRDCTGEDCIKAGGWFHKIAARLKNPTDVVGRVFSEKRLRQIWSE